MSATPSTEREKRTEVQRGPSLVGYLAVALAMYAIVTLLCVVGVFDERITPLWNPAILAPAALGLLYVEPRPPVWKLAAAGALLGLAYGVLVLGAEALGSLQIQLDPADLLLRALAFGVVPPLVGRLLMRWFFPATASGRPQ